MAEYIPPGIQAVGPIGGFTLIKACLLKGNVRHCWFTTCLDIRWCVSCILFRALTVRYYYVITSGVKYFIKNS